MHKPTPWLAVAAAACALLLSGPAAAVEVGARDAAAAVATAVSTPSTGVAAGTATTAGAGSPGEAAGRQALAVAATGSTYLAVTPSRVMPPRTVTGGTTYTLTLPGVPAGATAVALNLAVTKVDQPTFVSACPGGTPTARCRTTSVLNAAAGQTIANHVVSRLGGPAGNQVTFFVQSGAPTLVADLQGWYSPAGSRHTPVEPSRVMPPRTVTGGTTYTLTLPGVPAGATAVALNLAVTKVDQPTFVSACPGGTPTARCRTTSVLNAAAGQTIANHVVSRLGGPAGNQVTFFVQSGAPTLVADLQGWYSPAGSRHTALDPSRVMPPRTVTGGTTYTLTLPGVPAGATAVALNLAVTKVDQPTFVSACAGGTLVARCRTTSVLNAAAGQTIANRVVLRLGGNAGNEVTFFVQSGAPTLVADLQGYWTGWEGSTRPGATPTTIDVVTGSVSPVLSVGVLPAGTRLNIGFESGRSVYADLLDADGRGANRYVRIHNWTTFDVPRTGEWYLVIAAYGPATITVTVSTPVTGAVLPVDGGQITLPKPRVGQESVVDVGPLPQGHRMSIQTSAGASIQLLDDTGAAVDELGTTCCGQWTVLVVQRAGTYRLRVTTAHENTLVVQPVARAGPILVDGPGVPVLIQPRQVVELTIDEPLTAGQLIEIHVDLPGSDQLDVELISGTARSGSVVLAERPVVTVRAPATGAHRLVLTPSRSTQGVGTRTVHVSTPLRVTRGPADEALVTPSTRPGQGVVVTVPVSQPGVEHRVAAVRSGLSPTAASGTIHTPAGEPVWAAVSGLAQWVPETTGEYTVHFSDHSGSTAPWEITASVPVRTEVVVDGDSSTISLPKRGQVVEVDLGELAAGTLFDIGTVSPEHAYFRERVLGPDRTYPQPGVDGYRAEVTGRHVVHLDPAELVPVPSLRLTASTTAVVASQVDGPATLLPALREGQRARVDLGPCAPGTSVDLHVVTDADASVDFSRDLVRAGSPTAGTLYCSGRTDLTVRVQAVHDLAVSGVLTASTPVTLPVVVDGPRLEVTADRPGQGVDGTFDVPTGAYEIVASAQGDDASVWVVGDGFARELPPTSTLTLQAGSYAVRVRPVSGTLGDVTLTVRRLW